MSDFGPELFNAVGDLVLHLDGTVDVSAELGSLSATTATPVTVYFPPGVYWVRLSVDLSEKVTLKFAAGAYLQIGSHDPTATVQLTLRGPLDADPLQIFDVQTYSNGLVVFESTTLTAVYPEWWGATGPSNTRAESTLGFTAQDVATNTLALQAAIDAAFTLRATLGLPPIPVLLSTMYWVSDTISVTGPDGSGPFILRGVQGVMTRGTGVPGLVASTGNVPLTPPPAPFASQYLFTITGAIHVLVEDVAFATVVDQSTWETLPERASGNPSTLVQIARTPPRRSTALVPVTQTFRRCSFQWAFGGSLVEIDASSADGTRARSLRFDGCRFDAGVNQAAFGARITGGGQLTARFDNCSFTGGDTYASNGGGGALAMILSNGPDISLWGCQFQNVQAPDQDHPDTRKPDGEDIYLEVPTADNPADASPGPSVLVMYCESQSSRFLSRRILPSGSGGMPSVVPRNVVLVGVRQANVNLIDPRPGIWSTQVRNLFNLNSLGSIYWEGGPAFSDLSGSRLIALGCRFNNPIQLAQGATRTIALGTIFRLSSDISPGELGGFVELATPDPATGALPGANPTLDFADPFTNDGLIVRRRRQA